jgi:hypothetical protein
MFQKTTPNSNPPMGLLKDRNAPNTIETVMGSIRTKEISMLPKIAW